MTHFKPISEIEWIRASRPRAGQAAKPGSQKAAGLLFESQIADILAPLYPIRSQWFKFKDAGGTRHCAVDFIIVEPELVLVECKLNHFSYTRGQILRLYRPIVAAFYGRDPICLVALASRPSHNIATFGRAVNLARPTPNRYGVW